MFFDDYKNFHADSLCYKYVDSAAHGQPWTYLINYRLPEDLVITPSSEVQFFKASAKNRFIRSVTVNAVTTTTPTGTAVVDVGN